MALPEQDVIEREIHIHTKPETVFAFFVEPAKMIQWKGIQATMDARPGGMYRVQINARDVASGSYVQIEPFDRIVFTWGWEGSDSPLPPGASTVEVTFESASNGTLLRLRHYGLPPPLYKMHVDGWDTFLPRLHAVAEGRDPGPDVQADLSTN
ncbi:MAG: SRPBCC domain-containing protein [Anaerolineae bacterium]|nr:SRPBCC domain-containing protein [Anaerolineae bacterium]